MSQIEDAEKRVGVNQSWQDMKAQRTESVNYVNTTGRPIYIGVSCYSSTTSGRSARLFINDIEMYNCQLMATSSDRAKSPHITAIIPNGATYRVNITDVTQWWELR